MTIKDIARMAGVSVSTVSRVLNNHSDVSAPIRAQVLAVVEQQHFVPNNAARNLVRPRRNSVGVIQCGSKQGCSAALPAIEEALRSRGFGVCLRPLPAGQNELAFAAELERSENLLGILFLNGRSDYRQSETVSLNVPFVCCGFTNRFGDLPQDQYSSVSIDYQAAAKQAVRYLNTLGHHEIALLLPHREDRSIGELSIQGYIQALESLGLEYKEELICCCGASEIDQGYEASISLLRSGASFTALMATSDLLALAAVKAMHDSGISVPEHRSVMSLNGWRATEYTIPPLTALLQPQEEIGAIAVRLLAQILEGSGHEHIIVEPQLRQGGSVLPRNHAMV